EDELEAPHPCTSVVPSQNLQHHPPIEEVAIPDDGERSIPEAPVCTQTGIEVSFRSLRGQTEEVLPKLLGPPAGSGVGVLTGVRRLGTADDVGRELIHRVLENEPPVLL